MDDLARAWSEYLDVLAVEAPATRATIQPTTDLDLDAAQRDLRVPLLPDLVTWFGLHGGSGDTLNSTIVPGCTVFDLPSTVSYSVMVRDIWWKDGKDFAVDLDSEEGRTAGSVVGTWPDEYLMIGSDGSAGGLFIDQRPGPLQGCLRRWDKVEADYNDGQKPIAVNLSQMVINLTAAVRNRTPIRYWVPKVTDGNLAWDFAD